MMARALAEERRPFDDTSKFQTFPKYGKPLVRVGETCGKATGWTAIYGLVEWLDVSGKYHIDWAHSSNIKRVKPDEWKGSSRL